VCAKAGSGVSPRRSEWIKALIAIELKGEFFSAPDSSHAHTPLSRILFLFRRGGTPLPAVAPTHTPTHSHTHTPLSLTDYMDN
jgi:hypothetical protein